MTVTNSSNRNHRVFCFDIDGVICTVTPDNNYSLCQPCHEVIEKINVIYSIGHKVILFTARGYKTGIDWSDITRSQLQSWGVKYHELLFGKPAADYYIDDRNLSLELLDYTLENLGINLQKYHLHLNKKDTAKNRP